MITSLSRTIALAACAASALSCSPLTAGEQQSTPDEAPQPPVSPSWTSTAPPKDALKLFTMWAPYDFDDFRQLGPIPYVRPPQLLIEKGLLKPSERVLDLSHQMEHAGIKMPKNAFAFISTHKNRAYSYNTKDSNELFWDIFSRLGPDPPSNLKTEISIVSATLNPLSLGPILGKEQMLDRCVVFSRSGENAILQRRQNTGGITKVVIEAIRGDDYHTAHNSLDITYSGATESTRVRLQITQQRKPYFLLVNYDPNTKLGTFIKVHTSVVFNDH